MTLLFIKVNENANAGKTYYVQKFIYLAKLNVFAQILQLKNARLPDVATQSVDLITLH